MAQTSWMFDLLLILTPDCVEEADLGQEHLHIKKISLQSLDSDAQVLMGKLDFLSTYINKYQKFILFWVTHFLSHWLKVSIFWIY